MQTIGERLLEARQRRGVSIREAAESTKVRGDYLAAMENNQFDSIQLADVYRRGFLKIYAKFLRLDSDRVVNDYNALLAARNPSPVKSRRSTDHELPRSIEMREPEGLDEFSSGAIEIAARPNHQRRFILIGGGASLAILLIFVGVKAFSGGSGEKENPRDGEKPAAAATEGKGTVVFTSRHNAPMSLVVTRTQGGPVIFSTTIAPGSTVTMHEVGQVLLTAKPLDKLNVQVNGENMPAYDAKYSSGWLNIPAPKGR